VTESDASIMLEESAMRAIADILVTNNRQGDDDNDMKATTKQEMQTTQQSLQ
jgi:hypothetical protein